MKKIEQQYQLLLKSINLLPQQIEVGKRLRINRPLLNKIKKFDNIIICGMGGSALGFDLIRHALAGYLKKPIIINSNYHLPIFANNKSLIILSSYSGTTAEVISCAQEAQKKKYTSLILCGNAQSPLTQIKTHQLFTFDTSLNPSQQPRWGLGYSIGFFTQLLSDLQWSSWPPNQTSTDFQHHLILADQQTKLSLRERQTIIIAAEHLIGNAHILNNQINETAKNMSFWLALPELNHHFLEGLSQPKELVKNKITAVFLESSLYSQPLQKRLELTKQFLQKKGAKIISLHNASNNVWLDSLSTLHLGAMLCYDMARWNKVDPMKIPSVDSFKAQLSHR